LRSIWLEKRTPRGIGGSQGFGELDRPRRHPGIDLVDPSDRLRNLPLGVGARLDQAVQFQSSAVQLGNVPISLLPHVNHPVDVPDAAEACIQSDDAVDIVGVVVPL
jgi:hypothetical protein